MMMKHRPNGIAEVSEMLAHNRLIYLFILYCADVTFEQKNYIMDSKKNAKIHFFKKIAIFVDEEGAEGINTLFQ